MMELKKGDYVTCRAGAGPYRYTAPGFLGVVEVGDTTRVEVRVLLLANGRKASAGESGPWGVPADEMKKVLLTNEQQAKLSGEEAVKAKTSEATTKKGKPMPKKEPSEVVRTGTQIIVPDGMALETAIDHLKTRMDYEEQQVSIEETVDAFVWDGAIAFQKAMKEIFGWADAVPTPGFFGPTPPQMLSVDTGYKETILVPWGQFKIPGVVGVLETGMAKPNGMVVFAVSALIKRKGEPLVRRLIERTRELVASESIYRGKAFKIRLKKDSGKDEPMPMPKFLNLSKVDPKQLIFSDVVNAAIETNIFAVLENTERCREFKIPLKRGVLLYGPYGTGKSLTSYVTAKKCEENRWTFLYCERADELADMVKLAHHFQPAVVFCEDIDRAVAGERTIAMDEVLNIIDGIESKGVELMVILTTNHVEEINQALLRPGRLDAVINVLPPDAKAVERLIRSYGGKLIPENADLTEIGKALDGKIPAVIREVVEKAKLSAIKLGLPEDGRLLLTPAALLDSAESMRNQLELLNRQKPEEKPQLVVALEEVVKNQVEAVWRENN